VKVISFSRFPSVSHKVRRIVGVVPPPARARQPTRRPFSTAARNAAAARSTPPPPLGLPHLRRSLPEATLSRRSRPTAARPARPVPPAARGLRSNKGELALLIDASRGAVEVELPPAVHGWRLRSPTRRLSAGPGVDSRPRGGRGSPEPPPSTTRRAPKHLPSPPPSTSRLPRAAPKHHPPRPQAPPVAAPEHLPLLDSPSRCSIHPARASFACP
jgi:hypothetical protein